MFERAETSAGFFNGRSNPLEACRASRSMRQVTGSANSSEAPRRSMVVHDVEGPIVTGVLGGD